MTSRGRGRRGRLRGAGQTPPIFDQQAFTEAIEVADAAFAQASAAGSQGGPSNLQRFKSHHPPTFIGGGIRLWQNIGFDRLRRYWRLWILPSMRPRSG